MSLKLAITIEGDPSSAISAFGATRKAMGELGQAATSADAQVQTSAAVTTAATKQTGVAISAVAASAKAAQTNVVQLSTGFGRASAEAKVFAANLNEVSAKARQAAIDAAVGVRTDFGTAARAADIAAYGKSLDDLRAKYNPLFAAGRTYKATLDEIRQAEKVGAISAAESAEAIARTKAGFAAQVVAINSSRAALGQHAGQMKLSGMQATQLSYQLNDVVVSLASGQNPLMVAIQQGSQITPIFGGVKGTFAALLAFLNPVTVGIGAAVIAVGALGLSYRSWRAEQSEIEVALQSTGRGLGITVAQFDAAAEATSRSANVSVASARSMQLAFAASGKIGVALFGDLAGVAKDYAATMGVDLPSSAEALAKALEDPAKGAADLNRQLGFLDARTRSLIDTLTAAGDRTAAQRVLLDALRPSLVDAAAKTSALGNAWAWVTQAASGAADAMSRGVDSIVRGPSLAEQLAAAQSRLAAGGERSLRGGLVPYDDQRRAQLQAQIDQLKAQIAAADQAAQAAAAAVKANAISLKAADVIDGFDASLTKARELQQKLGDLTAATRDPAAFSKLSNIEQAALPKVIDAYSRALDTARDANGNLITETERRIALDRIDIQIQQARDPVTKADLAAQRERIELGGQVISTVEAEVRVQAARNKALADGLVATIQQIGDLGDETAARKAVNDAVAAGNVSLADAEQQIQTELQIRPLMIAALKAEGAERERLLGLIDQMRAASVAAAAEQRRTAALQQIQSQQDDIETTRTKLGLIGQSEATQARTLALLQAEQRIRSAGIAGTPEADRQRALAVAAADANTELERQQAAFDSIASAGEGAIDTLTDALSSGELSMQSLSDTAEAMAKDVLKSFTELAVGNPLKNALFGRNLPTLQDAGGILGKLLGGKDAGDASAAAIGSSVAAMNVQAGTVVVNGAIGGQVGSLLTSLAGGGKFDLGAAAAAIKTIESGSAAGNYSALGPVTASGDRAYGAYQVMGANIPAWTQQWFGQRLSPSAYLANSAAQDAVFNGQFGSYAGRFGATGAAQAWFGGPGSVGKLGASDTLGTTVGGYGDRFGQLYNQLAGTGKSLDGLTTAADKAASSATDFGSGLGDVSKALQNGGGAIGSGLEGAAKDITGSAKGVAAAGSQLETSATSLTGQTEGLFQSMLSSLGKGIDGLVSGIGNLVKGVAGGGGGAGGGLGGVGNFLSNILAYATGQTGALYHAGGMVGDGGSSRLIHSAFFANAPRFHAGGLFAGERAAIVREDEGIFTPRQMDNADKLIQAALQPRTLRLAVDNSSVLAAAAGPAATRQVPAGGGGGLQLQVVNNLGVESRATATETTGSGGERQVRIQLDEVTAASMATPGTKLNRSTRGTFGLAPQTVRR